MSTSPGKRKRRNKVFEAAETVSASESNPLSDDGGLQPRLASGVDYILRSVSAWLDNLGIYSAIPIIQNELIRMESTCAINFAVSSSTPKANTAGILRRLQAAAAMESTNNSSQLFSMSDQRQPLPLGYSPSRSSKPQSYTQSQLETMMLSLYLTLRTLECNDTILYIDRLSEETLNHQEEERYGWSSPLSSAVTLRRNDKRGDMLSDHIFPSVAKFWIHSLRGSDVKTVTPSEVSETMERGASGKKRHTTNDSKPATPTERKMTWGAAGIKGWEVMENTECKPAHLHMEVCWPERCLTATRL
jgi:hypothetical protein